MRSDYLINSAGAQLGEKGVDTCQNGERRINAEWTEETTHGADVSRRPGTLLLCVT